MNLQQAINLCVARATVSSYLRGVMDAMAIMDQLGVTLDDVRTACDEVMSDQKLITSDQLPSAICSEIKKIALEIATDRVQSSGTPAKQSPADLIKDLKTMVGLADETIERR